MQQEIRNCQNCKKDFVIEADDFAFYEKMKVPSPTFCPECRMQRRFAWRNERNLYKRDCDLCKKEIISMYTANAPFPVYCHECWYSDNWDGELYGREYDFQKPFFVQYKELLQAVPRLALWQRNVVDSEFSNMVGEAKNVYLSVSVVSGSENVFYSKFVDNSFNIVDSFGAVDCDGCYENIEGVKNYNCYYTLYARNCIDSRFLIDCVNCKNCILCSNLRNKEFYIRNKQYTKREYFDELKRIDLGSKKIVDALIQEWEVMGKSAVYKYANIVKSQNSTGNNLLNVKNCKHCFDVHDAEDGKFCYRTFRLKNVMDFDYGSDSELVYEYSTGAMNDYNVKFSFSAMGNVRNADYTDYCISCTNIFGCVGLRNKEFTILNKIYSKKEFELLREKIIEQMNQMPYADKRGISYKYGEFPPIEFSPFSYNETIAQEYFPITKEEAVENGYSWADPKIKNYVSTLSAKEIPDNINEVENSILKETIECEDVGNCNHGCTFAFRIIKDEFNFYKKHNIPLPSKCPNCRYYDRLSKILPIKSWHRKCMKPGCQNEFEASYAPDRPEIVYCEQCYNAEVA